MKLFFALFTLSLCITLALTFAAMMSTDYMFAVFYVFIAAGLVWFGQHEWRKLVRSKKIDKEYEEVVRVYRRKEDL